LLGAPQVRVVAWLVPLVSDEIEYCFYRPRDEDLAGDVCHDGYPPLPYLRRLPAISSSEQRLRRPV
jgi:hypothetical protein